MNASCIHFSLLTFQWTQRNNFNYITQEPYELLIISFTGIPNVQNLLLVFIHYNICVSDEKEEKQAGWSFIFCFHLDLVSLLEYSIFL